MSDSPSQSPATGSPSRTSSGEIPVSFSQFVVSLASSALVHLGEIADPTVGARAADLKLARHTIDVLGLLKDKTAGNLDEDETRLLDALLFDLRQKYTQAASKVGD
ncbi:MAG: DUF1844 domain-containing protein [Alphaproteobacteria bacterium]|nr:DUF1844 domain-containing protein [Alphaproteobacteria bacterium]